MKIGIFPGSFNPVHIGHLAIANYIAEYTDLDEIWFLITPKNPLKTYSELMDHQFRLELIEKSIGDYPKFKTCTIEWDMPQPSYTINTLQRLRMNYPEHQFTLLIGSDNWDTIHRWKDYQILLKNFKTLIYPRPGGGKSFFTHPNAKPVKGAPKVEVSSSQIRQAFREGKDVRFLMPQGVYEAVLEANAFPVEPKDVQIPDEATTPIFETKTDTNE